MSWKELQNKLQKQGIKKKDIDIITSEIEKKIKNEAPPKIALIGFTGVGKSSTINALFNAGLEISDVKACTQHETEVIGNVKKYTGSKGSVIIYDMPGLGEDINSDKKHIATYQRILPLVDLAVWTFQAGDRAMTPMQMALLKLIENLGMDFVSKLVFSINKADSIAPGESDWNEKLNAPSSLQRRNIAEFEQYISSKIRQIIPNWNGQIITYSAKRRFRLESLMTAMVQTVNKSRMWVLGEMADIAPSEELMDPQYRAYVNSLKDRR